MTVLMAKFRPVKGKMRPTFYVRCARCGNVFFTAVSMDTICARCSVADFAATITPEMMEPRPAPTHAIRTGKPINWESLVVGARCCLEHGLCPEDSMECGTEGCGAEVVKVSSWPCSYHEGMRRESMEDFWGTAAR